MIVHLSITDCLLYTYHLRQRRSLARRRKLAPCFHFAGGGSCGCGVQICPVVRSPLGQGGSLSLPFLLPLLPPLPLSLSLALSPAPPFLPLRIFLPASSFPPNFPASAQYGVSGGEILGRGLFWRNINRDFGQFPMLISIKLHAPLPISD